MNEDGSEILRASAKYVTGLRQAALNAENLAKSDEDWDEELAALINFEWLCAKYKLFWYDSVAQENHAKTLVPDCPIFTPVDFERLVQAVLLLVQDKLYSVTAATGDGGIDLIHQECLDSTWDACATTLVQCKLYRGFVPISEVRDFFGVISAHTAVGIFVTTGRQTSQAQDFLPLANASPHSNKLHFLEKAEWEKLLNLAKQCYELLASVADSEDDDEIQKLHKELHASRREAYKLIFDIKSIPGQRKLF